MRERIFDIVKGARPYALFLVLLSSLVLHVNAQTLPYFCGFEDPVENANWVFRCGSSFSNPWTIGTADANYGTHSMYVSHNNGATTSYLPTKGSSLAYREFTLPAGIYDIDFDWKCLGNGTDQLYVCWVTNTTENVDGWVSNNNGPGTGIKMYGKTWATGDTVMGGYSTWQHGSFVGNSSGGAIKLVFFWTNSQSGVNNPGGCIDNVQINRRAQCPKPTNVTFTLSSTSTSDGYLSWSGNGTSWDVMYKNSNDSVWQTHTGLTSRVDTISGLTKGVYTFWVRAHCGSDSSSWSVITNVLVYTTLAACIDYIDLDAAQCRYGDTGNPYISLGKVDRGSKSIASRHTIHYGIGEYDVRTNNKLITVPNGEVASVRLGNWATGGDAESISYDFVVDSSAAILVLKYAIVLEQPSGHNHNQMPRFKLEVMDSLGNLIDPSCGQADFVAGSNTASWNAEGTILWKDWTTVGLNLSAYANRTLTARLTTYDCSLGGHYGYAYFTLDCALAKLEGETCGGSSTTSIIAPEGFVYEWYAAGNPSVVVSTDRDFTAMENDTSTYVCRVIFAEDPSCYFELSLELSPKWPVSAASFQWKPENCRNVMEFKNESFVSSNKGIRPGEYPSSYKWVLSDGRESTRANAQFVFPNKGGTYLVSLITGMAEDQCQDTLFTQIVVPELKSYDSLMHKNICEGGAYAFNNKVYTEEGFYSDTLKTKAGCDSIISLNLRVFAEFTEHKYDTICDDDIYDFHGRPLSVTGVYVDTLSSADGCDSIVTLHLQVNPVMTVVFDPLSEICADDADFTINFTPSYSPTHYAIRFGNRASSAGFVDQSGVYADQYLTIPLPTSCIPDIYDATIEFTDSTYLCGNVVMPFHFSVLYPDSIMRQKFDNVLSLKNEDYNGGFQFSSYQWYKNGNPMVGETGSYIYLGEGNGFSQSDSYRVLITRYDGTSLMSCEFFPITRRPQITVMPTILGSSEQIRINISGKGIANLWSTGGILLRSETIFESGRIVAPREPGIYILQVVDGVDQQVFRLVVTGSK